MDEHKTVLEFRDEWDSLKDDKKALASFLKERGKISGGTPNLSLAMEAARKISDLDGTRDVVDSWLMQDEEYLGIVAILAMGKVMEKQPGTREAIALVLHHAVLSKKWRIREAVPLALKDLTEKEPEYVSKLLDRWTEDGYPIMYRTAIEILGDVKLLKKKPELRKQYRNMQVKAMSEIAFHPKETGKPMELLRKTLNSSITTLAMLDKETFSLMEEWAKDPNLRPILRKNLGNPHFRTKYPDETERMLDFIETGH